MPCPSECMFDGDGDGYGDVNPPVGFDVGTDCDAMTIATRFQEQLNFATGVYDNCEDFDLSK